VELFLVCDGVSWLGNVQNGNSVFLETCRGWY